MTKNKSKVDKSQFIKSTNKDVCKGWVRAEYICFACVVFIHFSCSHFYLNSY